MDEYGAVAQEVEPTETYRAPPYQLLRAQEQYTYLRDGSPYGSDLFDPVKFIPLNASQSVYFTLGGEIRPRFEYFDNEDWEEAQEGFLGSEVVAHFEAFDNKRNDAMLFWGVYGQFDTSQLRGATQIYYFGFAIDQALYNDGLARETRHTLGIRRFGSLGEAFRFNTEWIIQLGTFGEKEVRAFAIETDYHYRFHRVRWRPEIGLRLDYMSGDKTQGDDQLGTFNPLFTNPSYFGLLAQITPLNLMDIHPSVKLELTEKVELVVDWDFFWRAQKGDGLYRPPRFLSREGHEAQARFLGHQPGFELVYGLNRHVTLRTEASYFITGAFIEETGEAENIFHFATTVSYKF